ncbi:MAG: hypothetical protein PVG48_00935, partial [Candidatus Bathyarchaeota archaeon]
MTRKLTAKKSFERENDVNQDISQKESHHSLEIPTIQIIGVKNLPVIKKGDNLAELVCNASERQRTPIEDDDILV